MPACITRFSHAIDSRWLTNKCVESTRFMRSISFGRAFRAWIGRALEPPIVHANGRHLALRIFKLDRKFAGRGDRKSTRLNSSHVAISYAVFCLKKKRRRESENRGR